VEGIPNWKSDCAAGFSSLGVSERRRKLFDSLKSHDLIITYVTRTGFVDVREITESGTHRLKRQGYPEGLWPWYVNTKLVVSLGLERGISPNQFPQTKLCAGKWRYRFQQSGRVLEPEDGDSIARAIIAAANNERSQVIC
jgi:hypothetical protein